MKKTNKFTKSLILASFFSIVFTSTGNAYLDLGTGSYIFQVVIAFILGGFFAIKLFWQRIKDGFKNFFARSKTSDSPKN